jgi:GAF domain-containing protein
VEAKVSAWSFDVQGKRLIVCLAAPRSDARHRAEERARRLADTQKVIGTILENALEDIPLDELLRRTLDLILWIPWLSIERKGAIFLVDDGSDALVMKVQRGLTHPLLSACARVLLGTCICGQAAATRTPIYVADVDDRHTTRYPGMAGHGHYCVPICSGGSALGVITTYLASRHEPSAIELEFLLAVADALAGAIIRHREVSERRSLQRRLSEVLSPDRRG